MPIAPHLHLHLYSHVTVFLQPTLFGSTLWVSSPALADRPPKTSPTQMHVAATRQARITKFLDRSSIHAPCFISSPSLLPHRTAPNITGKENITPLPDKVWPGGYAQCLLCSAMRVPTRVSLVPKTSILVYLMA